MTYKTIEGGYAFWNDVLLLPMKKKDPNEKQKFFRKEVTFEEASNHWEYIKEECGWSVYYVKKGVSRRLARCGMPEYAPEGIMSMLYEKEITVSDCSRVERAHNRRVERQSVTNNWCVEWDGKPVLLLVMNKPKMTYAEILRVIQNEGGYVDSEGFIHKGTAENKVYTLD